MTLVAEAPGKLYILGEYAVVEPGHRAVLVAVDRTVRVEIDADEEHGLLQSSGHAPLLWRYDTAGDLCIEEGPEGYYRYVLAALVTVDRWRAESGLPARHCSLRITSSLDDAATGRKLGLGSSAAVTVATVGALCAFHGLTPSPEQIYRLAMLATTRVARATSGGDLAASALGGWISYASPDRDWLAEAARTERITDLLERQWPGLHLQSLGSHEGAEDAPPPVQVRVGWTGEPAETPLLVGKVRRGARIPQDLLERSDALVHRFIALLEGTDSPIDTPIDAPADTPEGASANPLANFPAACAAGSETHGSDADGGTIGGADAVEALAQIIPAARTLLAELAHLRGTVIETPELTVLCDAALDAGWQGKSSGAGGGDCGIALGPCGADAAVLEARWSARGILPLNLSVSRTGLCVFSQDHITEPEGVPA